MGLELGVLLADERLLERAMASLRAPAVEPREAGLFLMDEGVRAARAPLVELLESGVDVSLCAGDAEARGVSPFDGGPRFGSQYDHAVLVRDARRFVALTGTGHTDEHAPPPGRRAVRVRLTRAAGDPKTAQALRSAVGYAAGGLDVVIAVEPAARAILAGAGCGDLPQPIRRALGTLRALGHRIAPAGDAPPGDLEVTW
jgi:hypothetical protein